MGIRAIEAKRVNGWEHLPAHPAGNRQAIPHPGEAQEEAGGDRERLQQAVTTANQLVSEHMRRLSFDLHEESDRMVVRVIDLDTNEVIRQIPPEQVLASLVELRKFIGLLLDRLA